MNNLQAIMQKQKKQIKKLQLDIEELKVRFISELFFWGMLEAQASIFIFCMENIFK